jgi:acetoacetate decarboxylase
LPYTFQKGMMYRMPTHFGPAYGPRQGVGGKRFANLGSPKSTSMSVSFLTNREQLEEFLPEGFEVGSTPVVTVGASYMTEIEWLAGRGYNTLGVSFPAVFTGKKDHAVGRFLTVLWENLTDPILTGREELGFSKIYCDLPEPRTINGQTHCIASWMGFKFLDLKLWNMKQQSLVDVTTSTRRQRNDGTLHYKYMPRTGDWGTPDIAYAVLTPSGNSNTVVQEVWRGEGSVQFHKATWEDLPTQFNIVNAIQSLEIKAYRGASIVKSVGGKDLSDQRILQ